MVDVIKKRATIYLEAKDLYMAGRIDDAWEHAKTDPSMHRGVTREIWLAWIKKRV